MQSAILFVVPTTYIYCAKAKKYYWRFFAITVLCNELIGAVWFWLSRYENQWLAYLVVIPFTFLHNYLMVRIQIKCIKDREDREKKTKDTKTGDIPSSAD